MGFFPPAMPLLALIFFVLQPSWGANLFTLTLIHTNDAHAHYAPFTKYGSECSASQLTAGKCYGGVARLKSTVDNLRAKYPGALLCDAGDQSQGTLWYTIHRYNITAHFMNKIGYDIMCAGNHEFDNGERSIIQLAKALNFPMLCANLNDSQVPDSNIIPSSVLIVGGQRVGFIGYTTRETAFISMPERFGFTDEVEAVRREVARLKADNVDKIIALGHAGIDKDREIARAVDGVDVVIGGHSNTFLYNGDAPSNETPMGPYPLVITQPSGRKVLVVQAFQFVKYLGLLHVTFDQAGHVVQWEGNPLVLNSSYPEDEQIKNDLEGWKGPLEERRNLVLGKTRVLLDASSSKCRYVECSMGNMIVEGYVDWFNRKPPPAGAWASIAVAMANGGAIRSTLLPGQITLSDLLAVQPFGNTIDLISLKGRHLRLLLEYSLKNQIGKGGFLQFAGLRVSYWYDQEQPHKSNVTKIALRCTDCLVPVFLPLEEDKVYQLAISSFLLNGGDGYGFINEHIMDHTVAGEVDSDLTAAYIQQISPVAHGLDGRIQFDDVTAPTGDVTSCPTPMMSRSARSSQSSSLYIVGLLLVIIMNIV